MSRKPGKPICSAAAAVLTLMLCACGGTSAAPQIPVEAPKNVVEAGISTYTAQPAGVAEPTSEDAVQDTAPPTAVFTRDTSDDEPVGPDVEERERVEDSYFADSAFLGNSLVDGLARYGGLEHGDFYAATSASVLSVGMTRNAVLSSGAAGTMMQALCEKEYSSIYILLGINEIAFETDYFIELYGDMLDRIAADEPDADIYIMSLTPVTEKRDGYDPLFNMERIAEYNDALYSLAEERGLYYLDLVEALADEGGYLSAEMSTDGIHMTEEKYMEWADYLRTHYVGDK